MKGLLIKDLKLLKNQRLFFAILVGIAVGIAVFQKDSASFIVGYLSFICTSFTLSTISYDEYDNGYAFLFTLPISRNEYVAEKYCFGMLIGGCSWLAGLILAAASDLIRHNMAPVDTFMAALLILSVVILFMAVMIPVQLKFGGERSRIVMLAVFGLLFLLGFLIVKIAGVFHIDLISILNHLPALSMGMVTVLGICAALLVLLISYKISAAIMKRREF